MATIIDSLIVTLGLDSKGLDSKTPEATRKVKDLRGETDKVAESSKKASAGFGEVSKALAGFLAVIGGTVAIKRFIEDQITANAALDRFAKNLGLSVTTLSAWGNAVEELGGNAKGLQGSMDMLSKSQTELRLTGQSSLIPYFSAL